MEKPAFYVFSIFDKKGQHHFTSASIETAEAELELLVKTFKEDQNAYLIYRVPVYDTIPTMIDSIQKID